MTGEWRSYAACVSADPTLFDPDSADLRSADLPIGRRLVLALDYCRTCPVARVCLLDAVANLDSGVRGGVWLDEGQSVPMPGWSNPGPGRTPYPCGTEQAWLRHKRWGEAPCDECHDKHEALKEYNRRMRHEVAERRRMTGGAA